MKGVDALSERIQPFEIISVLFGLTKTKRCVSNCCMRLRNGPAYIQPEDQRFGVHLGRHELAKLPQADRATGKKRTSQCDCIIRKAMPTHSSNIVRRPFRLDRLTRSFS